MQVTLNCESARLELSSDTLFLRQVMDCLDRLIDRLLLPLVSSFFIFYYIKSKQCC